VPPFEISLMVNGLPFTLQTEPCRTLLSLLREDLHLLSVKEGCGQGDCGACVVVLNGEAVNACLVLAAQADGAQVVTLEGLATEGGLHPLQRRFMEYWAFQCGFCTPGMILSCYALLQANPQPTPDEIREAIAGNLCRCTSYHNIVSAVQAAAADLARPQGAVLPADVTLSTATSNVSPHGQRSEESRSGASAHSSLESRRTESRPANPLRVIAGGDPEPSAAGGGAP
jgi:aerobic carbon-monoxide dehydrogenase small subunit